MSADASVEPPGGRLSRGDTCALLGHCPGYDDCGNTGFCGPGSQCCNNNQYCCSSSKAEEGAEGAQGTPVQKAVEASFANASTDATQAKASTDATQRCLARFKSIDTNKNGNMSHGEFLAWDKSIELVEFDAKAAQDSNAGKK